MTNSLTCSANEKNVKALTSGSLRKQPSFFASNPSGVSHEGAKKDGCFRRLDFRLRCSITISKLPSALSLIAKPNMNLKVKHLLI